MSNGADFDDSNPAIVYSGGWQALTGTISQQFDNTIHQTSVTGASATIKFSGTRITVYQTVPEGVGSESITIDFDGSTSSIARDTHPGTSYYQDQWFDSGPLTDGVHLLTLTNAGVNGGTPFMLDRVNVEGTLIAPPSPVTQAAPTTTTTKTPVPTSQSTTTSSTVNTPSTTSTSTSQHLESTSTTSTLTGTSQSSSTSSSSGSQTSSATPVSVQTVVSVQYVTNSADGAVTAVTPSASSNDPVRTTHGLSVGAIVGVTLAGVLAILLLLLLLFCLVRRRRKAALHIARDHEAKIVKPRNQMDVSPFHISRRGSFASPVEQLDIHDMSVGLARKASDTSTTSRRESFITSNMPPSSNRVHPEKSSEFLSDASNPIPNTLTFAAFAPSNNAVNRIPETDAGPFRPSYLSGDTMYMSSSGIYSSTTHLNPVDTNDVPPSYQSAGHRNSGT